MSSAQSTLPLIDAFADTAAQPVLSYFEDMAAELEAPAPAAVNGRVLRWVEGIGTTLVPCTIVTRDGAWTTVTLQDGTTVRTCTEYVLADQ